MQINIHNVFSIATMTIGSCLALKLYVRNLVCLDTHCNSFFNLRPAD